MTTPSTWADMRFEIPIVAVEKLQKFTVQMEESVDKIGTGKYNKST